MAAGSHLENGIWADLVIPAIIIRLLINIIYGFSHKYIIDH